MEPGKRLLEVGHELVGLFGLDYDVIYVCLNGKRLLEAVQALLDQARARLDVKGMLGDLPMYDRHI